jgi:hypothetical protein
LSKAYHKFGRAVLRSRGITTAFQQLRAVLFFALRSLQATHLTTVTVALAEVLDVANRTRGHSFRLACTSQVGQLFSGVQQKGAKLGERYLDSSDLIYASTSP